MADYAIKAKEGLFRPGENCWRAEDSQRFSILVDGKNYFSAVKSALARAERRVFLLGWDFDGTTKLRPHRRGARQLPIGNYLYNLAQSKPDLEIYILIWWGSVFYGTNPDGPINFGGTWLTHPRIHYRLDDRHPVGASHHQKIICVDDKVAFVGGMDITQCRWDNCKHSDENAHRCDGSTTEPYGPVHDMQTVFDGKAARAISELVAERWRLVTGEILTPVSSRSDPWPYLVPPLVTNHSVAIARSHPPIDDRLEAREIESMNIDMLKAARRHIYIEQQYYTIPAVNEVLCDQLQRADGAEVVILCNNIASGWIEQTAMFDNRDRLFSQLRRADRHRRLRMFHPVACAEPVCEIKVHSKVVIIDDRLIRVGSSNFNQRSLGLDTECDVVIEGETQQSRRAIEKFTYALLAEHLCTSPRRVARFHRKAGSLIRAIDTLNTRRRHLLPFPYVAANGEFIPAPGSALLDPPRSIDLKYLWDWLWSGFQKRPINDA